MCGIAGVVQWKGEVDRAEIEAMTAAVRHRGPDGEGFFVREGVMLGHRRLAIIDLEGGKQPLANETGSVWITFNGEIYNYKVLRAELIERGHRFATHSDTEVIVHAYEEWGTDAASRLRGMFAFVIADFDRRRVFMARDQFGIKPLFYRFADDRMTFGSEIAALQAARDRSTRLRPEGIDAFLRYRYVPGPETIFQDIRQLPPATSLTFDFDGGHRQERTYWTLRFEPDETRSLDSWLEEFDAVLQESVRAHLVADVPFGVFLSGGIDSTLVARAMRDELNHSVIAFSIGFNEEQFSELKYAEHAAKTLGIDLRTEIVTPNIAEILPQLVVQHGQPYADTSMIPTWYLCRLARRSVPMVLSGDGGDEAFGGYLRYACYLRDSWLVEALGVLAKPHSAPSGLRRFMRRAVPTSANRVACFEDWVGLIPWEQRRRVWKREFAPIARHVNPTFADAAARGEPFDALGRTQYLDFRTYLPYDILAKVDIASMAHGLEVRPPLIDTRVVEFAARLPMAARLGPGGSRPALPFSWRLRPRHEHPWTLKWLPKRSLSRRFDDSFVHRPKMGFGIPETQWLQPNAPVRRLYDELVAPANARIKQWFRTETLDAWMARLDSPSSTSGYLWSILILALWLEQNPGASF
ncbi:MAG: asparagine synthase (glutamine-hydrolyzing) [Planctomycetota bacterium]